jgi:hypothetical protein
MKTSTFAAPKLVAAILLAGGCYAPQPTTLWRQDELPDKHWYELSEDDKRIKALAPALQNSITQQRQLVAAEMEKNGSLSPDTRKKVGDLDETCNGAYLVSFDTIANNPTPELNGQFESWDRRRQGDSMVYSENLRMLADEWSRFMLMERPGGSPYDTVNTTGRF